MFVILFDEYTNENDFEMQKGFGNNESAVIK